MSTIRQPLVVAQSRWSTGAERSLGLLADDLGVDFLFLPQDSAGDVPTFRAGSGRADGESEVTVSFTKHADPVLRGAGLAHAAFAERLVPGRGDTVLAEVDGAPVWTRGPQGDSVAVGFDGFDGTVHLREFLGRGRFLPLLPLIDFARRFAPTWNRPVARAAILFDDPNLHANSYGYLDYRTIANDLEIPLHVAVAMIPLDGWYAAPTARALFRARGDRLSILYHGNDHVRQELARPESREDVHRRLAQAVRRMRRFERRYGLHVNRVMAPPHGVCSETAAEELRRLGFDALCASRPYPWLLQPPPEKRLAGLAITEVVAGGLPVVPRLHLAQPRDELILRAFLGQPLVLYGHHEDIAAGTDALLRIAESVNKIGAVQWCSLEQIVRSSYEWRRTGPELYLRLHARRVRVEIPDDVEHLVIQLGFVPKGPVTIRVGAGDHTSCHELTSRALRVLRPPSTLVDIDVMLDDDTGPDRAGLHRWSPWPHTRRLVTETRDRVRAKASI